MQKIYMKQMLIYKRESTSWKYLGCSKAFIEYSNDMDDIYKNIQEYNSNNKQKNLIVFADMLSNTKFHPAVTELLIRRRKLFFYHTILFGCSKSN